jgi:hypothetical protein
VLTTIGALRDRIAIDQTALIKELQDRTGRYGDEEAQAWKRSLPKLGAIFSAPSFQPLHLYFGSRGNLAVEYQLPAASSWCDVVMLGAHSGRASAVIVELKDWVVRGDRHGRAEGLIERQGRQELHPSDQVRGYTNYCRRFHSAIAERDAMVHGCVLFTNDRWSKIYSDPPNERLAEEYPLFSNAPDDIRVRLPGYFSTRLTDVDEPFAIAFAEGGYRQDRGFVAQIGTQILNPTAVVFELLDNQRKAFALCRATIKETFHGAGTEQVPKKVVIVKGPPGSGKSVIAARLWASLVTDEDLPDGDVVFTTTSMSQNSNWEGLFDKSSGIAGASGVVRKANSYIPLTTHRVGQLRKRHGLEFLDDADAWREHLETLRNLGEPFREGARDNQNLVSIVDEAHALINPEHAAGRGQFGFPPSLGPQAYHIIRSSLLTVFLLDPRQGFRERENTSVDDIRRWSEEAGAGEPEVISLEGMQFRCAGSAEYVEWVESVLEGAPPESNCRLARTWQHVGEGPQMEFAVFDNPEELERTLRAKALEGHSARLVSTYSRKWATRDAAKPHALPPSLQDFHESYLAGGEQQRWSRIWNYVPQGDYTWFVAGFPGSFIAEDPLCEVGCPYAVRGFDYDYVGILWLNDLEWREGRWRVNAAAVEESGIQDLTRRARREQNRAIEGTATAELLERVGQAYRILLTRALKGVYVWVPDAATREYLVASAENASL